MTIPAGHDAHHGPSSQDFHLGTMKNKEHMFKFHEGQAINQDDTLHRPKIQSLFGEVMIGRSSTELTPFMTS